MRLSYLYIVQNVKTMQDTEEIWKDVPGYEGEYQISNLGRTKALPRLVKMPTGVLRKEPGQITSHTSKRYCTVDLSGKSFTVHRLVANAFIPNPENKPEVNHRDGNKRNNVASNLEWVTRKENIDHAFKNGLKPNLNVRLSKESVKEIKVLIHSNRVVDVAYKYGVSTNAIHRIKSGKTHSNPNNV